MLTGATERGVLGRALQSGCAGYLTKGGAPAEIEEAIRRLQRGESVIPAEELARLLEHVRPSRRGLGVNVSAREREVLALLAKGLSTEEITHRLALTRQAVAGHLQRVIEKLDAQSGLEAVTAAVREGVIELTHR
jgi:DNA-binding NarL/FixJ family response regulator